MGPKLTYSQSSGIYLLEGIRVVLLPRGSLEAVQEAVNKILGLATKSIFEEAMSTVTYSFLTDMMNKKIIRKHSEDKMIDDVFTLFKEMGFGRMGLIGKDLNTYTITIEKGFNSLNYGGKAMPNCFEELGHLKAIFRVILEREVTVEEDKCRAVGDSDMDVFKVTAIGDRQQYTYIPSMALNINQDQENIEPTQNGSEILVNSIPVEIIPVTLFPYLFSKLRNIVGLGVYGIENNIGMIIGKLYNSSKFEAITAKYNIDGPKILSPLIGIGLTKLNITDAGLESIDIIESFNALHVDELREKRCFLISGLLSSLSYGFWGNPVTFKESSCSAVEGDACRFVMSQ